MKIGIFYGSTTGNTANAAGAIKAALESLGEVSMDEIASVNVSSLSNYDLLILGSSTWGMGEIQDDWFGKEELSGVDLSGKKIAVFGTGDQAGFSDTFVDAIGLLANAAKKAGATLIGKWPIEGYDFFGSAAVRDEHFSGLALDDDNQPDLTAERIGKWTTQLKDEL